MRVVSQKNFIKGLDAATSKLSLQPGTVPRNSNLLYSKRGSLLTCDGVKQTSSTIVSPNGNILAMGAAGVGANSLIPLALCADTNQINLTIFDFSFQTGRQLFDIFGPPLFSLNAPYLPQLVSFNNGVLVCISNFITPYFLDSPPDTPQITSSGDQTTPPGAAHAAYHQGKLWLFNTGPLNTAVGTTSSNDGPSTIRMSGADQNDWPNDSLDTIDQNDGTQGQGLASFTIADTGISPTASLIAFKDFATYQLTGLLATGGNFAVTKAQTDMGCVAPRSIQFAPGFGIVRMSHIGVALFDGISDTLISEEVRPYLSEEQLEPDIVPMDWARVRYCYGSLVSNPPLYVLAIPVKGKVGLTRILAYDLVIKAWSVIDLPFPINCMAQIRMPGQQPTTYFGGQKTYAYSSNAPVSTSVQPTIWRWQSGDPDWDGTPIRWSFRTPEVVFNASTTRGYFRRAVIRGKTYVNSAIYRAIVLANTTAIGSGILSATNASPIVCVTNSSHGLTTGMSVTIAGGLGNAAINGTWTVTVLTSTKFSLNGSTGNGAYTANSATITNNTVASTTILVRGHGLESGGTVVVAGIPIATPDLNGTWMVTVLNADEFTIPVAASGSISAGGWIKNVAAQFGSYNVNFSFGGTQISKVSIGNSAILTPLAVYGGGTTVPYLRDMNPVESGAPIFAVIAPGFQGTASSAPHVIDASGSDLGAVGGFKIYDANKIQANSGTFSAGFSVKATASLLPQPTNAAIYGFSKYSDGWVDLVVPVDIGITSFSAHADISGAGSVELYAVDWHVNDKPPGAFARAT